MVKLNLNSNSNTDENIKLVSNIDTSCGINVIEPINNIISEENLNIDRALRSTSKILDIIKDKEPTDMISEEELTLINTYLTYAQESLHIPVEVIQYNIYDIAQESFLDTVKSVIEKILDFIKKIINWFIDRIKEFVDWIKDLFNGKDEDKKKKIKSLETKSKNLEKDLVTKYLALGDAGKKLMTLAESKSVDEKTLENTLKDILSKSELKDDEKDKKIKELIDKFKVKLNKDNKKVLYLLTEDIKSILSKSTNSCNVNILEDLFNNLKPTERIVEYTKMLNTIEKLLDDSSLAFNYESLKDNNTVKFFNDTFNNKMLKTTTLNELINNKNILDNLPTIDKQGIILLSITKFDYENDKVEFIYKHTKVKPKKYPLKAEDIKTSTTFNSLIEKEEKDNTTIKDNFKIDYMFNFFTKPIISGTTIGNIDFSKTYKDLEELGDSISEKAKKYAEDISKVEKKIKEIEEPETMNLIKNTFHIFDGTFKLLADKTMKEMLIFKRFHNLPIELYTLTAELKHSSLKEQATIVDELIKITKKKG